MGALKPKFSTYQDVRTNLATWSVAFWTVCVFVSWQYVLTPEHRLFLATLVPGTIQWVRDLGKFAAAVAIGTLLSVVLVHWLEIHDHWYDRYIVHWRRSYVRDFMIPALLDPYVSRLPDGCVALAQEDWKQFMGPHFYEFAGDRHTKISPNLLVRFYERVTKYWLAQLAEIAALLLIIASAIYWLLVVALAGAALAESAIWVWGVSVVVLLLSRGIAVGLRGPIREATQAEIDAIHSKCSAEFEKALSAFCAKHGKELKDA